MANCFINDLGKILKKLRADYSETQRQQAERLGYTPAYLSMVSTGRRDFSFELYRSIAEHYKCDAYRDELTDLLLKKDVRERFFKIFPDGDINDLLFILHGTAAI